MILPIGDTPNPKNYQAWVTWALMALNILVYVVFTLPLSFVAADPRDPRLGRWLRAVAPQLDDLQLAAIARQVSAWDLVVFDHGFLVWDPSVSDLLTGMFMHAGLLHLAGNMLFLWIYGDNVEHRLGRLGFLTAYLGTGAISTLVFALLAGDSGAPLIGASGAISGVLGLYALMFPGNRVKVFVFLFPIFMRTVLVPAWIVLGVYLLIDNMLPLLFSTGGSVAHGAHVGGFVAGVMLGFWGERRRWRWPWSGVAPRSEVVDGPIPIAEDLARAITSGDRRQAVSIYGRMPVVELQRLSVDHIVVLADWLEAAGYDATAEQLLRRGLSRRLPARARARIHLALGLARLRSGQGPLAWQHLRQVAALDPDPETERAALLALDQIGVGPVLRR
jgi:membrane associated rhomboid family serine protease